MNKIQLTDKAKSLILLNSKVWLCDELDMSRPTLDTRLEDNNWGKLQKDKLIKL